MSVVEATFWTCAIVLTYIYLIYPGLMWIAGHLRTRRKHRLTDRPSVTLVVPAHNEAEVLNAKLANIFQIDYPADRLEIIVASDGSTDETVAIARQNVSTRLKILDLPRGGKATALNAAVAEATGDIVCLCDANVMFRPDAITRLVERFGEPGVGAVTGDVRLASYESDFGAGETIFYEMERQIQRGESRFGSVMGVDGGMYVVRRELFQPIAPDTILDDFTLSIGIIRQGFRIAYEPAAIATENGTPTSAAEFHRRVRIAAGSVQSLKRLVWPPISRPVEFWQYLSHKFLRWLGPYVVLSLLATSFLLAGRAAIYDVALVAQALVASIAFAATISARFRRTTLGGVPFYFMLSNVAMVLGHAKGLFDRQSVAWSRTERVQVSAGVASLGKTTACGGPS